MKSQGAAKNEANNAAQSGAAAPAEAEKTVEKIDFSKVKVEPLFEEMVDFDTFSKSDFRAIHEEEGEEKLHLLMVDNHIPAGAKLY